MQFNDQRSLEQQVCLKHAKVPINVLCVYVKQECAFMQFIPESQPCEYKLHRFKWYIHISSGRVEDTRLDFKLTIFAFYDVVIYKLTPIQSR